MTEFDLVSDYKPAGDQPKAIAELVKGLKDGMKYQTLLGVTGSGKTFTMANVIAESHLPTLIMSHNKTLAAQLFSEFKALFPKNAVEYFVSYYDYYQPEAYIPRTDTYIDKEATRNEDIERMRLSATAALVSRRDTIIIASVSCIYGIGVSIEDYQRLHLILTKGKQIDRENLLNQLVEIQYERNDLNFQQGKFRVRGDIVDIFPPGDSLAIRVELFGDEVDQISRLDPLKGEVKANIPYAAIYPAKHFVTPPDMMAPALKGIGEELEERLRFYRDNDKLVEAQRLEFRTRFDLEMLNEVGFCSGVENYSRHLAGRQPGDPPYSLVDYFPKDFLTIIDESHVSVPQIGAMLAGDRSRKQSLVDFGFRLPSAFDNRPLSFPEFEKRMNHVIFTSATPANYEFEHSAQVVEQIVRPTGLIDPALTVKPVKGQVDDLLGEINSTVERKERVLVTTLTKRMAEDLTSYYANLGIRVRYLHSEIDTLDRIVILEDLLKGEFDVLIGINLLREGLDLPQVSLVAILDADKMGFLRSERSLIQTIGRASRNVNGRVIMYADRTTDAMKRAIDETNRRRRLQEKFNSQHGIVPKTIVKGYKGLSIVLDLANLERSQKKEERRKVLTKDLPKEDIEEIIKELKSEMRASAKKLDFEHAAQCRDRVLELKNLL